MSYRCVPPNIERSIKCVTSVGVGKSRSQGHFGAVIAETDIKEVQLRNDSGEFSQQCSNSVLHFSHVHGGYQS